MTVILESTATPLLAVGFTKAQFLLAGMASYLWKNFPGLGLFKRTTPTLRGSVGVYVNYLWPEILYILSLRE